MAEQTIPARDDIDPADQWDLRPLFDRDDHWEEQFSALEKKIGGYDRFQGELGTSPEKLLEAVSFDLDVSRQLERLYTYAHLRSDEDRADTHAMGLYQKALSLHTRVSEASSYMRPELMAVPEDRMDALLQSESLAPYRFHLERILRYRRHTLSGSEETLLAMGTEVAQAASQIFGQLDNVDLDFGVVTKADGTQTELSHGNFITFMMDPDREIRKIAFDQYYAAYTSHRFTLAAALSASVKKDVFYARARKYDNCRAAALFADRVPESVYDALVDTVNSRLSPLYDYLDFRRDALGLDALHIYDTYVPLVADTDFSMPYEQAVDLCAEAMAPLGDEYVNILREGLLGGWVDRYENRGKRSGAYSSGCYDSPPYILLNYDPGTINSLYTLIHEAGHSMHSFLSNRAQPYVTHDYAIFVAEVASTFNETLLSHYLMSHYADNPAMQAYILNREIDNIRATLFRQTMFAEFEAQVHAIAENHEPLTLDVFTDMYGRLLEKYFGNRMVIDPALVLECFRIPHFYSAFYVYKYATGISAAISLAQSVLSGEQSATENYLEFLSLGGSRYPLDALTVAGVDMQRPDAVEHAISRFGSLVDQLKGRIHS